MDPDSSQSPEPSSPVFLPAETIENAGGTPWENRKNIGFFSSLWQTWVRVMFSPREFFARMPISGGIGAPLGFAIILGIISLILGIPSNMITQIPMLEESSSFLPGSPESFLLFPLVIIIISPIWIPVYYFILGVILHLGVLISGGRGGYEATFRVLTYCASTNVFQVVPFIGGLINGLYGMILAIIGFKIVHNLSTGRVVFAILFPTVILFMFVAFIVLLVVLFIGTSVFDVFSPEGLNI